MSKSYEIRSAAGNLLGTFPAISDEMKALCAANPGSRIKARAAIINPCQAHPAFEADNCPGCGTETKIVGA